MSLGKGREWKRSGRKGRGGERKQQSGNVASLALRRFHTEYFVINYFLRNGLKQTKERQIVRYVKIIFILIRLPVVLNCREVENILI